MTTFFEHQRSSYKKNYMRNLISLASSDGKLDDLERTLIMKIGQTKGLKDWQVDKLLVENEGLDEVFLPESLYNRMNLLYDFMQIVYADGVVSKDELDFMRGIIINFNLRPAIIDHLIDLFQYGNPSSDDWKEFVEHASEVFVN